VIANRFTIGCVSAVATKAVGLTAAAPSAWAQYPGPGYTTTIDGGPPAAADPTMITKLDYPKQGNTTWVLYGTGNQAFTSLNDRVKFYNAGLAHGPERWWSNYSSNSVPWAPDVRWNPNAGKYFMYYAMTNWGSPYSAIGMAVSSSGLPGTWIDHGSPVLWSSPYDPWNAIDPHLLHEGNRAWLTWGSFENGIYTEPVDPGTGLPTGAYATNIVNHGYGAPIEGADLMRWGSYYYLFFSQGSCCNGFSSDYNVRVGRSTSPTGPFVDKSGRALTAGGGSVVLASHDWVHGPGGQNLEWDPWDNKMFMLYHYWDTRYPESRGRVFGINHIQFDGSGWPCWC
jgi:arabinan endo-1,5-alpha-L-arabinosidase